MAPKKSPSPDAPTTARLGCGCTVAFRAGVEGSPVTVVLARKAETCPISIHVGGLPLFDHREALRPATRLSLPPQADVDES
jgi:hypothetical protein